MQTTQMLGSSSLVNRQVMVPSSTINYSGGGVTGSASVGGTGPVTVSIADASGKVVRTLSLGSQNAGLAPFSWDGKDDSGNAVAQGAYSVSASSNGSALNTYVAGKVTAVDYGVGGTGTYLQVDGVGGVPLTQVAQIF
jgi:flagellar basal-body rod modification protein FlgD